MQGKPKEAETAARAALTITPAYPPALENLGAALFKQSRYLESATVFRELSRAAPRDHRNSIDLSASLTRPAVTNSFFRVSC